jgi:copper resistance protein C
MPAPWNLNASCMLRFFKLPCIVADRYHFENLREPRCEEVCVFTKGRTMVVLLSASLSLGSASAAMAHAHLVSAVPPTGGAVHEGPSEVTLHFSERLEPAFSSVTVRDASGKQIDKGDSKVDKSDRTVIRVSLPSLEHGVYKVEWRAVSADTHKVSGDFIFKVGE